mmetsp:Transcript_37454/g.84427  ORF Transcript_37454/g.84427 Transcript_37454/m.84427 type:complete len:236 (+) Transcript_37454:223-930(+)
MSFAFWAFRSFLESSCTLLPCARFSAFCIARLESTSSALPRSSALRTLADSVSCLRSSVRSLCTLTPRLPTSASNGREEVFGAKESRPTSADSPSPAEATVSSSFGFLCSGTSPCPFDSLILAAVALSASDWRRFRSSRSSLRRFWSFSLSSRRVLAVAPSSTENAGSETALSFARRFFPRDELCEPPPPAPAPASFSAASRMPSATAASTSSREVDLACSGSRLHCEFFRTECS